MNAASLENCKRLYELSGWDDTSQKFLEDGVNDGLSTSVKSGEDGWKMGVNMFPAYDAGYLLRKFKEYDHHVSVSYIDYIGIAMNLKEWRQKFIAYNPWIKQKDYPVADSPEDCLVLLAIQLFERGISTTPPKEEDKEV